MVTPAQPVAGADDSRVFFVTGGTGGIGYHSSLNFAKLGGRVIISGRNRERGEAAVRRIVGQTGNERVELVIGSVSSKAGVDALAEEVKKRLGKTGLDVLVNNAGYFGNEFVKNEDGLEMNFAVNVFAPWRLTWQLLPALKASNGDARVVNVTAGENASGSPVPINSNNLQAERGFKGLLTMAHSKSVMEAMSVILASKLQKEGITVNVVFPGRASTALTRSITPKGLPGPMKLFYPCMKLFFRDDGGKAAAKACRSTVHAATSPELDGITGKYYDQKLRERKMHKKAQDPQVQEKILALLTRET